MRSRTLFTAWLMLPLPYAFGATLHEVVEQAWLAQPEAQTQAARAEELTARRAAAQAWSPQPAALSLAHKTDRIDRNDGANEWELEFGLPLWQPGERGRQTATVDAEGDVYAATQREAKWRFAGEVREAWWRLQLAASDAAIAARKLTDAKALAADLARRLQAGDSARVDFNLAQMAAQSAQIAQTQANATWQRAQGDWAALTQAAALPSQLDLETEAAAIELDQHPALQAATARVTAARARLALAGANLRESPELSLALTRERRDALEPYGRQLTVRLKLPFGGDNRNHPRQAAANAELIEAQSALDKARRLLAAEVDSSRNELRQQQAALTVMTEHERLAQDSYALLDKAFRLGHIDLAKRLRADSDRFEAEQGLARAHLEAARALARYNQALGWLP